MQACYDKTDIRHTFSIHRKPATTVSVIQSIVNRLLNRLLNHIDYNIEVNTIKYIPQENGCDPQLIEIQ